MDAPPPCGNAAATEQQPPLDWELTLDVDALNNFGNASVDTAQAWDAIGTGAPAAAGYGRLRRFRVESFLDDIDSPFAISVERIHKHDTRLLEEIDGMIACSTFLAKIEKNDCVGCHQRESLRFEVTNPDCLGRGHEYFGGSLEG